MKSTLPTLSIDEYLTNKHLLIPKLWLYYLAADKSQSSFYNVSSLKYDLSSSSVDRDLSSSMEKSLESLYGAYFDKVTADVNIKTDKGTNTQYCRVSLTLEDDGQKYYLLKELETKNGEIKNYHNMLHELYEEWAAFNQ